MSGLAAYRNGVSIWNAVWFVIPGCSHFLHSYEWRIFYAAPNAYDYRYDEAMKEYAEKTGTKYINLLEYMDEMGFDPNTDFWDKGHLNCSGSKKVALFLGKYIVENYEVTDMRDIKDNQWQKNLEN